MINALSLKHYFEAPSRSPHFPGWAARYGLALAATFTATVISHWISPFVNYYVFDLYQGAVVLSVWYGGLGPGLLTAALSMIALDYFFMTPINAFATQASDFLRLAIFAAVALFTSSLSNQLKRAKLGLEEAHEKLEERIAQRTVELSEANSHLTTEISHRLEAEKAILEISNREQQRLGQDLHDGLCQTLAGVRLFSGELKKQLLAESLPQAKDVAIIESRLAEALTQADVISRGLYPVELETNGLMAALEELATHVSKTYPVICRFKCMKPLFVTDTPSAIHIYRIAQEAVANAIKGGKAKHVTIRLLARPPQIILSITDDGIGMKSHRPRKGMGLKIMEYRARMINARLRFISRAQGWTRVSCTFSLLERGGN